MSAPVDHDHAGGLRWMDLVIAFTVGALVGLLLTAVIPPRQVNPTIPVIDE